MSNLAGYALVALAFGINALPLDRPERVVIVKERWAPLTQWDCSRQEWAEYIHACTARARSARIGGKHG